MKRCPQCNRIETDDALAFCRVDGTRWITDSEAFEPATAILTGGRRSAELATGHLPNVPSIAVPQILDGQPPANTGPIRVDTVPGTLRRYSGGGVTIEQLLLTDVVGKPFPVLMKELVLKPIGMTHSTFEQPLPAAFESQTASAHNNGTPVTGRYHVYPEMAAAGLWTTPTDLLKWAIEVAGYWLYRPLRYHPGIHSHVSGGNELSTNSRIAHHEPGSEISVFRPQRPHCQGYGCRSRSSGRRSCSGRLRIFKSPLHNPGRIHYLPAELEKNRR